MQNNFPNVSPKQSFPALESEVLAYWKANNTFKKSIESRSADNPYRFYDGPPFITGTPHYGSLLSSVVKDVVGRYWTMRGKQVDRVWGWDCHGLPIEEKVQKKLGLASNKEIEERGIKEFIDGCYEYTQTTSAEWDWYIDKIGRWVDMDRAYRTMDQDYMESVMWVFKQLWDKGLIYKGKRVSLYSWKLSTPISNFEVAMDDTYQEVNDPAITVKFPLTQDTRHCDQEECGQFEYTDNGYLRYVLGVIQNEKGEILQLKNRKHGGTWQCPGGKIDAGETAEQALKREILEELGVECEVLEKISENKIFTSGTLWQGEYYRIKLLGEPSIQEPQKHEKMEWARIETDEDGVYALKTETETHTDPEFVRENYDLMHLFRGKNNSGNISVLAWTTTPWTIPANMALSVGKDIIYALVQNGDEQYIVARSRAESVFKGKGDYEIIREFRGEELIGMAYIPPFDYFFENQNNPKNHKVYHADFATDTDGTGIVHTAPEFGDVDYALGKELGLTITEALDNEGKYTAQISDAAGMHYLDANKANVEKMKANGTLFKNESITHRIPFCPRSGTPLVQKAQDSWFIDIQSQKEKLLQANEHINWFPTYLKHGRFAKGIESAPDWCISRTRFWGAPMPVWVSADGQEQLVVASREEIFELNKPYGQLTKLIFTRHAESEANADGRYNDDGTSPLSETGKKQAEALVTTLENTHIDVILSSPAVRARDTLAPLAKKLGMEIITDDRLREVNHGNLASESNTSVRQAERDAFIADKERKFGETGETYNAIFARLQEFIADICDKYPGKTVLVASHGMLASALHHWYNQKTQTKHFPIKNAEPKTYILDVANKIGLNLHRPYIDAIKLESPNTGKALTRIPEVLDVWMDSGSMPYAQMHYPFENKTPMESSFPADFISEYVGQVRAWFYVMHVLGVLLGEDIKNTSEPTPSFTNVITTGVINGNDGRKMSKSYGNYPDPRETIEKYGADPIRFYMLNSPLLSGGDMDFKEEGIVETIKSVMLPIWNTYAFFTTYANIDGWKQDETEVFFVRHGESTSNIAGKISDGQDNPELTEKGRRQAEQAGETLAAQGKTFDIIIHTDRIRTTETAKIIAAKIGFKGEMVIDDGFAEQPYGEYAQRTRADVCQELGLSECEEDQIKMRKVIKNNNTENVEQFEARILIAYENILQKYAGKKILLVAHAGTPRPILVRYHGTESDTAYYATNIKNGDPFRLMTTPISNPLDQWVLSTLQVLIGKVHDAMEGYDVSRATRALVEYMNELTNWYVRLSRRRFWGSGMTKDKASAYSTLHTVLVEISKLLAPYMPFLAENMFRGLTDKESVHLEYITLPNPHLISASLNHDMERASQFVSLGLALRSRKNIRVRQPLSSITITEKLSEYYEQIIRDELNVKSVIFAHPESLAKKICKPDARKIGPKFGKNVQEIIVNAKNGNFTEQDDGSIVVGEFTLEAGEYTIEYQPLEGVSDVEGEYGLVIAMDTTLTDDLIAEGLARDVIRQIQDMRKEADYQVTDKIQLCLTGDAARAIEAFLPMIEEETLSTYKPGEISEIDITKTLTLEGVGEICITLRK